MHLFLLLVPIVTSAGGLKSHRGRLESTFGEAVLFLEKSRASVCEGEAGRINGESGEAMVELIVQPIDKGEEHLLVAVACRRCSRAGWNAVTERQRLH